MSQQNISQAKPKVFIGSSGAGLEVAEEIHVQLHKYVDSVVWNQEDWLGKSTLEHLVDILDEYNFAILVLRPDDVIEVKGQKMRTTRDNVLIELGLFMGRLGRDKTFIVFQDDPDNRIPSDLYGINFALYSAGAEKDLVAACIEIRKKIREIWDAEQKRIKEESQKKVTTDELDPLIYETGMLYRILNAASAPQYKAIESDSLKELKLPGINSFADIGNVRRIGKDLFRFYMFPYLKTKHAPPQRLRVYFAYYLGDGAPLNCYGITADPRYCVGKDSDENRIEGQFIIGMSNPTEYPEPEWMSGLPLTGYHEVLKDEPRSNNARAFKTRDYSFIGDTDNPMYTYESSNFKVENEKTVYSVPVIFSSKSWHDEDWRAAIGVLTVSGSHPKMITDDIISRADHLALILGYIFYLHTIQNPGEPTVDEGVGYEVLPIGFNRRRKDDPEFPKFVRRVVALRREIASHFEEYFLGKNVHKWDGKELSFVKSLS